MTARSFAYHAHGTADSHKFYCYPWLVYHDIKSAMQCSLRLAPTMINHLTSISNCGSPGLKLTIIPLCISTALLRSKHCNAELPLGVRLICAV